MKDVSRIVLAVATFSLLMLCAYVGVYRLAEKGQLATILSLRSLDSIDPVSLRSNPIVKMVVMTPKGPGELRIVLHKDWAPLGVQRFIELVDQNFYDDCRFFRVLKSFVAQVGINGDPTITTLMQKGSIKDDPVKVSNRRGTVTFATSGPDSRSTQIFINLVDNSYLDKEGFAPFGEVLIGMNHVDNLYYAYGEGGVGDGSDGKGPSQMRMRNEGNEYLSKYFPKLSYIISADLVNR